MVKGLASQIAKLQDEVRLLRIAQESQRNVAVESDEVSKLKAQRAEWQDRAEEHLRERNELRKERMAGRVAEQEELALRERRREAEMQSMRNALDTVGNGRAPATSAPRTFAQIITETAPSTITTQADRDAARWSSLAEEGVPKQRGKFPTALQERLKQSSDSTFSKDRASTSRSRCRCAVL